MAALSMAVLGSVPVEAQSVWHGSDSSMVDGWAKPIKNKKQTNNSVFTRYIQPTFTKPTGKPKTKSEAAKKKAKDANKSRRINRKK